MKKLLIAFASVAFFAACNSSPKTGSEKIENKDTVGLAEYQAWKEQQQLIKVEGVNEAVYNPFAPSLEERVSSLERANNPQTRPVATKTSTSRTSTSTKSSGGSGQGTVAQAPQTTQKKGWSKAAKGAVIGAGSGAVIGAVVSKNKVKGAIIGGVIGAGGGYAIGRSMDKKDGRY